MVYYDQAKRSAFYAKLQGNVIIIICKHPVNNDWQHHPLWRQNIAALEPSTGTKTRTIQ